MKVSEKGLLPWGRAAGPFARPIIFNLLLALPCSATAAVSGFRLDAVQHYVLLTKLDACLRPGVDILSQGFGALLPVIAVHSAVGLRDSVLVTRCKQTHAVEIDVLDEFLERLPGVREHTTGTELIVFALLPLNASTACRDLPLCRDFRILHNVHDRPENSAPTECRFAILFCESHF